jgi:hypothetical protein
MGIKNHGFRTIDVENVKSQKELRADPNHVKSCDIKEMLTAHLKNQRQTSKVLKKIDEEKVNKIVFRNQKQHLRSRS